MAFIDCLILALYLKPLPLKKGGWEGFVKTKRMFYYN